MEGYPVSVMVNNPRSDRVGCVEEVLKGTLITTMAKDGYMASLFLLSCTSKKRSDKFTSAVGKLLVNCGQLEALSVSWLMELGKNRLSKDQIDGLRMRKFKVRKDKILTLIRQYIPDRILKAKLKEVWSKTEDVMNFRNSIAHAPLLEIKGRKKVFYDQQSRTKVTIQNINPMIDQCSEIINEINELWGSLKSNRRILSQASGPKQTSVSAFISHRST